MEEKEEEFNLFRRWRHLSLVPVRSILTVRHTFLESVNASYSLCVDCTEVAAGKFALTASVSGPEGSDFVKKFDKPEQCLFSVPTKIATVLRVRNPDLYRELVAKKRLEDDACEAPLLSVPPFPMDGNE